MTLPNGFKAEAVTKIYMGRDRICRCGCAGEYQDRDEPMFAKRLSRFLKLAESYDFEKAPLGASDIGDNYLNISYGKDRALTVYFD